MKNLNGWQRIWILITVALAAWFVVLWPIKSMNEAAAANTGYQQVLMADFDSGKCQQYIYGSLESLVEPPYGDGNGGTCWHIYTTRTIDKISTVPFTKEAAVNHDRIERWSTYGGILGIGAGIVALASGALYIVGMSIRWVRRGFKADKT